MSAAEPETIQHPRRATGASLPMVTTEQLGVRFDSRAGSVDAIRDVTLDVRRGEFLVIVGPSGCGKTTLLRVIAGLKKATTGTLSFPGHDGDAPLNALVFQGRSVFPWMTVADNITYGLRATRAPKAQRQETLQSLLEMTGLGKFANAYPHQLSEGMRQRVAIGRALAVDPDLLLMDEPFGALDEQTRYILQDELLRIWDRTGKTVVFVTHSIDEALTLADRVVVMTAHPGTVKAILDVPFRRPREITAVRSDPASARLFTEIWDLLRDEVLTARQQLEQLG